MIKMMSIQLIKVSILAAASKMKLKSLHTSARESRKFTCTVKD